MSWATGLRLVGRADATPTIGAGHVMRLAALGAAWQAAGGEVSIHGEISIPFVRARLRQLGIEVSTAATTEPDILMVDSYELAVRFDRETFQPRVRVLVDDEGGPVPPGYDAVWNPNAYADRTYYPGFAGKVAAGFEAIALRDDLPIWSPTADAHTIVTLGGGDLPSSLADALRQVALMIPDHRFAVAGNWAPNGWQVVPPEQLWRHASQARCLVTGAGSTVWEAAYVGVPVILIQVAPNQRLVYRWGRDAGVPGLNALLVDAEFLAHQLRALLPAARRLPQIGNGAGPIARWLGKLVSERVGA